MDNCAQKEALSAPKCLEGDLNLACQLKTVPKQNLVFQLHVLDYMGGAHK
jgi:hypothetical protein